MKIYIGYLFKDTENGNTLKVIANSLLRKKYYIKVKDNFNKKFDILYEDFQYFINNGILKLINN